MDYLDLKKIENLKSLEVYSCKINLGDLKQRYIDIIDLEGDNQRRSTNIKADMTSWKLNTLYDEFVPLAEMFSNIYFKILETYHPQLYEILVYYSKQNFKFNDVDIWGAKYRSKEKTIPHTHSPAQFSMCLYLKTPKGCPGLSFNDVSLTVPVEENQMILFNGYTRHSVKSKKFRGFRYILAGNIQAHYDTGNDY